VKRPLTRTRSPTRSNNAIALTAAYPHRLVLIRELFNGRGGLTMHVRIWIERTRAHGHQDGVHAITRLDLL
jgi:hypothetical protein